MLLQLGFEQQVRQVEEKLPAVRQKLFFSATIPPRITKMAQEMLQDPIHISVGEVINIAPDYYPLMSMCHVTTKSALVCS